MPATTRRNAPPFSELFVEAIAWSDAEQALDTADLVFRAAKAAPDRLRALLLAIEPEDLCPGMGPTGTYWFSLGNYLEWNTSVWARFCPSGCVVGPHAHGTPLVAVVLNGLFQQTLLTEDAATPQSTTGSELYVRHEHAGQVFALTTHQRHATSSGAGSLLLALKPNESAPEPADHGEVELSRSLEAVLRGLRAVVREFPLA